MDIIKLVLDKNYESFGEFYGENIIKIYNSIIDVFDLLIDEDVDKTITLHIEAKINDFEWDTDFIYSKKNAIVLKRDLLPYFEKIEDYKTCIKIRDIYKKINGGE